MTLARISVDGRDLADIATDGIPDISTPDGLLRCAWALHRAVLQRAAAGDDAERRDGVGGWRWEGWVNPVLTEMWPQLAADDPDAEHVRRALNQWLRVTGNLICLQRGSTRIPSQWWVRDEFTNVIPERESAGTGDANGSYGGTHACGDCERTYANARKLNEHIYAEHRPAEDWLTEAMTALGRPATVNGIWTLASGAGGFPGHLSTVRRVLNLMRENGTVISDGHVWWLPGQDPAVPDDANKYPCREPGCAETYPEAWERAAHEKAAHRDSTARDWQCPVCPDRYYDLRSRAIHLARSHGMKRGTAAYDTALRQASPMVTAHSGAEAAIAQLTVIFSELTQLREDNARLTAENAQLAARMRRIRAETQDG
jgi:hypothetical protein